MCYTTLAEQAVHLLHFGLTSWAQQKQGKVIFNIYLFLYRDDILTSIMGFHVLSDTGWPSYSWLTPRTQLSQQSSFHCSSVLSWDRFWKQSGELFRGAVTSLWPMHCSEDSVMYTQILFSNALPDFVSTGSLLSCLDMATKRHGHTSTMMIQPLRLQEFTSFTQINMI